MLLSASMVCVACGGGNNANPVAPAPVPAPPRVPALTFTARPNLPNATIGTAYDVSFCDPRPAAGLFCGGPLPANPPTVNPTGGCLITTFRWEWDTRSVSR